MKIKKRIQASKRIVGAGEDDMMLDDDAVDFLDTEGTEDTEGALDEISDAVEDLQDSVDEVKQEGESIEVDNNIEDHYIAECESCLGVFISAVKESEEPMEYVHGTCPLCQEETDQYLKWVIRKV